MYVLMDSISTDHLMVVWKLVLLSHLTLEFLDRLVSISVISQVKQYPDFIRDQLYSLTPVLDLTYVLGNKTTATEVINAAQGDTQLTVADSSLYELHMFVTGSNGHRN